MRNWTVGKVTVTQIIEHVILTGIPGLLPDATPDGLLAIPWLYPEFVTEKGEPTMSLHALIIDTPTLAESIHPVIDAGLVDLVELDHRIDNEVRSTPTIGHTPGHVSIVIESDDQTCIGVQFPTSRALSRLMSAVRSCARHDRRSKPGRDRTSRYKAIDRTSLSTVREFAIGQIDATRRTSGRHLTLAETMDVEFCDRR